MLPESAKWLGTSIKYDRRNLRTEGKEEFKYPYDSVLIENCTQAVYQGFIDDGWEYVFDSYDLRGSQVGLYRDKTKTYLGNTPFTIFRRKNANS